MRWPWAPNPQNVSHVELRRLIKAVVYREMKRTEAYHATPAEKVLMRRAILDDVLRLGDIRKACEVLADHQYYIIQVLKP
jgi:hypothetical protein